MLRDYHARTFNKFGVAVAQFVFILERGHTDHNTHRVTDAAVHTNRSSAIDAVGNDRQGDRHTAVTTVYLAQRWQS